MMVEHLVGTGRRDAAERTAHFLPEMSARLKLLGLGTKSGPACPLSQYLLADAPGLSAVHVNRLLRECESRGWSRFGTVTFDDFARLVAYADFDRTYLDHDGTLLNQGGRLLNQAAKVRPARASQHQVP